jgi:glucosyl-dolichyl phosphate glucuronosyltransferase
MKISIIICTHRRFDLLKFAIISLCKQSSPKNLFEIIVVDNDISSNKEVLDIVSEFNHLINIRYLHEPAIGLSRARNTGGKAAKSEYVGYIDDDAKANEKYIAVFLSLIDSNYYDVIGGPYYAYYLKSKPVWFKDKYQSCDYGVSRLFKKDEFLNGTNMIFKKSLLENENWFDVSFGMAGKQIAYGEETNLQKKLWQKYENLKVFYSSDLIVYHLVPPNKMTLRDKFLRSYKLGKSQSYMWINNENIRSSQKKAPYMLIKTIGCLILKIIPKLFFKDKTKYPFWQNYSYEVMAEYFAGIGQEWERMKGLFINRQF